MGRNLQGFQGPKGDALKGRASGLGNLGVPFRSLWFRQVGTGLSKEVPACRGLV